MELAYIIVCWLIENPSILGIPALCALLFRIIPKILIDE
jgi:hypothetical protein